MRTLVVSDLHLGARLRRDVEVAEPVLRQIGARVGVGGEVILVPGNHDAALVRPWLRVHGVPAAVDAEIPLAATPVLEHVASCLAPARVRVHYPGVWLSAR